MLGQQTLFFAAMAIVSILSTVALADDASPADSYPEFAKFSTATFGAEHEPLTYQLPGDKLKFLEDGAWQRVSEDSATIAFETNLPTTSYVEYGLSKTYDAKTDSNDRPNYLHVHHLVGLKTGKPYHYRLVSTDERGNKITSADGTFTPKPVAGAIYLPSAGKAAPPFVLDKAGATYVLKKDFTAAGTAISVTAANVTIDLNGHTIVYNDSTSDKDPNAQKDYGQLGTEGVQGVRCAYGARGSAKLYNGFIQQGKANGGYGCVPILFRGEEIAGVTIDYAGSQITGIENEAHQIHHNVITDHGTELTNRHQGVQAINTGSDVHNNLIRRVRQRGISAQSNAKIYRNEIYIDSCATNSFGIMMYKSRKCTVTENRIFGTGYLAIGIGTVSEGVGDIVVSKNFIQMQAREPDTRWKEYGDQSGAYCVRLTWGGENVEYADNVMVSKGRDGGMVRGIWFCPNPKQSNVAYRRNTIKVLCENDESSKWGAIVVCGEDDPKSQPGLFENNIVISNFCNVRLGEEYGTGKNAKFVNNTFIREGNLPNYKTVICGFWTFNNNGTVFEKSTLKDGASFDLVSFEGTGDNSFSVDGVLKTPAGSPAK